MGKLSSLFWKPDGESSSPTQTQDPPKEVPVRKSVVPSTPAPASVSAPRPVLPGQVDETMAQILEDAIVASNLPGFDYLEFRDALVNMKDLPLPEAQKFQAVFATAQSMKVDKGKLLEAIDHYLKVVEKSSADFKAYIDGVTEKEVTSKSGTVDRLDQEMQKNAAEIQRLTQVVQELKKQQDAVRMEVAQAELEISNKKAAFEATQAAVTQNLTSDRSKIETYLV